MVSQDNESSKDFTAIECKLRILHMFQLQREIECNRGFESEDDDDDYESEDDDYDTQDDDEYDTEEDTQDDSEDDDDAEHTLGKETSPRRYRSSEFPLFSPTFWGNSANGNELTKPCVTPVMKDTSASRYRTSEFPLFSPSFWGESTNGKGMTEASGSLTTNLGKDCINPVPRAHEGHKPVPAHQPLGMALTSDDIGVEQRSLLEKKVERIVSDNGKSNNSANKYRGIPTFGKVRQKSLPPTSKRQECHMIPRQKSLPPIEKRRKPKTDVACAFNKEDTTGRSRTAKNMPVLARDLNIPPSKPRFQGGPYEAKPFKLLPPIAIKSGGKKHAKATNDGYDNKKKGNLNPIKVRHTKKSAQIEQKAKAKRDTENEGKRKASAIVIPPLVKVNVSSAPKSKSTASCITVHVWSTPKPRKNTLPLPPIRSVKGTSNASTAKATDVSVTSVVAAMSEKMDTTKSTLNEVQISSSRKSSTSRSSKSSRSSDIKRSHRERRSRSPRSRSSSSTRFKKSSRGSSPCRSSRSNRALRSSSPREVKKSARVSTTGSRTSINRGDTTSERLRDQASCTPDESRCDSMRSRGDKKRRSPSPLSSGRSSHPGSPHMKDKSDGNGPDNEYDYSPMSTARSSVHTNRSAASLSDTARTCSSASNASRNIPRVKSAAITRGSSNMPNVPKQRPASQSNVTKREPTRQRAPSRPNTAPGSQTDILPHPKTASSYPNSARHSSISVRPNTASSYPNSARHSSISVRPNTASSYPNSARHSSISVRPNTASLLRQKSISSRQIIALKRQSNDSIHRDTASGRQSITSARPSTAQARLSTAGVRPTTASTRQATEQNRPTTAPPHPRTAAVRPTTALASPTIALSHRSTTPSRLSTNSRSKIPIRIVTSPGKTSVRSAISSDRSAICSARPAISSDRPAISSARSAIHSARSTIPSAYSTRSTCSRNKRAVLKTPN